MSCVITPFDFYLLRLPILSLDDLFALHEHQEAPAFANALRALYQAPELQDAIYLASPELHQEMEKWLAQPASLDKPADERLLLTLYKYVLRMSSRCTPYGMFAGFNTGKIGPGPSGWHLAPAPDRKRAHARLDMNHVIELSQRIGADPAVRAKLLFYANNSLYKTGESYRYYEYQLRAQRRQYYLVSIKASTYLEEMLRTVAPGATFDELLRRLVALGVGEEAATGYLGRLIDSQVLLSELEPTVTGPEFYSQLVSKLAAVSPDYPHLPNLKRIEAMLANETASKTTYEAATTALQGLLPKAGGKDSVQVDLHLRMTQNQLSSAPLAVLTQELADLTGLYKSDMPGDLRRFINDFYNRYEEQEIPLLAALDSETGVGYGLAKGAKTNHMPFVDDLRLTNPPAPEKMTWTPYRQLVFQKYYESQQQQQPVVTITPADLAQLKGAATRPVKLPATLMAMGALLAASPAALDAGDFRFALQLCHGPGAMRYLARFAHADPALAAELAACAAAEQAAYGDALLAEIVHLPSARAGNIIQRTQLRAYEIPFLGQASVPLDGQIPVADLLVSVRNDRVVLRSKRLNKVILPRLTTAHNYGESVLIYKFLCDMQHQQESFFIGWDWGSLQQQPYLPRVEYQHIIVSRAEWHLPASARAEVLAVHDAAGLLAFRARYRLPEHVMLVDWRNSELLLDFGSRLGLTMLAQELKKGPVMLREYVHDANARLLVDDENKRYVNELIIPFARTKAGAGAEPLPAPAPLAAARPQRTFALGSEWTYLKVYSGAKWADKILTDYLLPCLAELREQLVLRQWFFIRYADPDGHLRVRIRHAAEPAAVAAVVARLHQVLAPLQQAGIVAKIQYDTYHREIERYGPVTMAFSEEVFWHDSQAVISFLDLIEGAEGEEYRWLFALRGIDTLLDDFGLELPQKLALVDRLHGQFFEEFNGNPTLARQLNDKYRAVSGRLSAFMEAGPADSDVQVVWQLLNTRSASISTAYEALRRDLAAQQPDFEVVGAVHKLLPSYTHMFLNRLFIANQRLHELVVYHHLAKYYRSVLGRSKGTKKETLTSAVQQR